MTRVQSRRHLTPIPFSVSGLMSWGQYTEDRFKWTPIVALSVSRGCLHNIGIIECHLTLATQTLSQCGERRITDDNKIFVYCNEIKSTLIHLKYSGTVERVSYKYIYLTTLSCHQSTGAWRRLRSGVTGTWETQIMSRCSVFIWFWFAPLSPVIHWLWLVDGDAVGGLLREPRPLWPTRHHRAQRAVSPEVGEERRH